MCRIALWIEVFPSAIGLADYSRIRLHGKQRVHLILRLTLIDSMEYPV